MSDEEEVTYPIDDVLAALQRRAHDPRADRGADQGDRGQEEPLPLEIAEFEKLQLAAMYFRKINL